MRLQEKNILMSKNKYQKSKTSKEGLTLNDFYTSETAKQILKMSQTDLDLLVAEGKLKVFKSHLDPNLKFYPKFLVDNLKQH
jgi:hypothetical protein